MSRLGRDDSQDAGMIWLRGEMRITFTALASHSKYITMNLRLFFGTGSHDYKAMQRDKRPECGAAAIN